MLTCLTLTTLMPLMCLCLQLWVSTWLEKLNQAHTEKCLADLKACKQSNIPVYSFAEHQRLEETKYLYGATVIIGMPYIILAGTRC